MYDYFSGFFIIKFKKEIEKLPITFLLLLNHNKLIIVVQKYISIETHHIIMLYQFLKEDILIIF